MDERDCKAINNELVDTDNPNRLFEIKMEIKKSRHEMYEKCFSNLAKPIVKFFTDDWFVLKR